MKKFLVLPIFLFLFSCSSSVIDIPKDFHPHVIFSGIADEMIEYSLTVYPPMRLRYSGELFLPVREDADLSFVFTAKFAKRIGNLSESTFLPDLKVTLYIKEKSGKNWYEYTFVPFLLNGEWSYLAQIILPFSSNEYRMKLRVVKGDMKFSTDLMMLFRNTPMIGVPFEKEFTLNRIDLIE